MRIMLLALVTACATTPTVATAPIAPPAKPPVAETERFDFKVRADFFDGLRGDPAALDRAMAVCDAALAKNPKDAEAMVWHGAGLMARSSFAFRSNDREHGMQLYSDGLAQMDAAVALAPHDVGVRIPRGAVLLGMAPFVPEPEKGKLLHRGVADYEETLARQHDVFAKLTLHSREQLLYGLVDGYANLGDTSHATAYYTQMTADAAGSELLPRAKQRAAGEVVAGVAPCEQCHGVR